ncbi:hypothetical protein KM918_14295 [Priestia megaterium]|uniref:hypothetical protein n=1 Tax=Priestia megaterium TaxID=1404 RepID=UPI001C23FD61|nr:hypothetical protein [Priestia megaterium]MBU8688498.1 hypothetical protein [Priestia megaterium]
MSYKDKDRNNRILKKFYFDEPSSIPSPFPMDGSDPTGLPVAVRRELVLAELDIDFYYDECDMNNRLIFFAATVGWATTTDEDGAVAEFRIRKGSSRGDIIFATRDGIGVDDFEQNARTTSFIHVDATNNIVRNTRNKGTKYFLTLTNLPATSDTPSTVIITGPVVFIGEIKG